MRAKFYIQTHYITGVYGVMVSTLNFEFNDPSSNQGNTFLSIKNVGGFFYLYHILWRLNCTLKDKPEL